jgi:hypothetical protein
MAASNLYPPIIDTFMPAFIYRSTCRVYFSLSDYNSYENVKDNVQVTVVRQDNNRTALSYALFPSAIKVTMMKIDEEKKEAGLDDCYYIEIHPYDLQKGYFEKNSFYKVQIRFTQSDGESAVEPVYTVNEETGEIQYAAEPIGSTDPKDFIKQPPEASWFTTNLDRFSEWSTVCLIKGIEQPEILLTGLTTTKVNPLTSPTLSVVGELYYAEVTNLEKEFLKYYQIILRQKIGEEEGVPIYSEPIIDSGNIFTDPYGNPNEINYTLKYYLEEKQYRMELIYTTNNLYTSKVIYDIEPKYDTNIQGLELNVLTDNRNGIIQVKMLDKLEDEEQRKKLQAIVLRRASSLDNFTTWETVHIFTDLTFTEHIHNDRTVESGIFYQYFAQYQIDKGILTQPSEKTAAAMVVLEDIVLTTKDRQLKVMFDPSVSSFNYTISENKTDTIGGKYPFIRRNAGVKYRTIPLSGTIYSLADEDNLFTSKEEIYGSQMQGYIDYNTLNNVNIYQDFVYERKFRDKVIEFLYEDDIKIYRSTPEGNLLVRLMNVTLTPEQRLGRMIYKFSCNAVEIADFNLENIDKFNLQLNQGEDLTGYKIDTAIVNQSFMGHNVEEGL